jgi:hypothetical protein
MPAGQPFGQRANGFRIAARDEIVQRRGAVGQQIKNQLAHRDIGMKQGARF